MKRFSSTQAGFNLLELLVVVAIISMLATIGFIAASSYTKRAEFAKEKVQVANLETAIAQFYSDTGRYPARGNLLAQLNDRKAAADVKWSGPYYDINSKELLITGPVLDIQTNAPIAVPGEQIADHWGRPLIYIPKRDYASIGVLNETPFAGSETLFGGNIWANSNTFQLISAGPDGKTRMEQGHLKPLVYEDRRDNDADGQIDEFEIKGRGTGPEFWAEDDIVNY